MTQLHLKTLAVSVFEKLDIPYHIGGSDRLRHWAAQLDLIALLERALREAHLSTDPL